MKKISYLLMAVMFVASFSFTSCQQIADSIEDSAEITIQTEFSIPLTVVPVGGKSLNDDVYHFASSTILDPAENEDLTDYLSDIKKLEIKGIKILIKSVSTTGLILDNSTFIIKKQGEGDNIFTYSTPEGMALVEGAEIVIPNDHPDWDELNSLIKRMSPMSISVSGDINNDAFTVEFEWIISTKITVEP